MSSIRCALGWHDWGRWRPFAVGGIVKQGRRCRRCGLCDGRVIADYTQQAVRVGSPDPESPDYDPRLYYAHPGQSGDTS